MENGLKKNRFREKLHTRFFLALFVVILVCCLLCSNTLLLSQDKSGTIEGKEILLIASFPKEEVPVNKWIEDNGWQEQSGSAEFFVIKDECLFMQNTNASTTIGLKLDKEIDPRKYPEIEFRARVDKVPPFSNVTDKKKDDSAFRLFVLFDKGDWLLSPPQTIGYVWDTSQKVGTTGRSESFGKVRYIVIGSGRDGLGEWREYKRNILEDYQLLFGSTNVPKIKAIGLKCDSNHTQGHSVSAVQWIRLLASEKKK